MDTTERDQRMDAYIAAQQARLAWERRITNYYRWGVGIASAVSVAGVALIAVMR